MAIHNKNTGKAMTVPGGVSVGGIFALVWTIIGAALLAKLIDGRILGEESIGYGSMIILLTASMLGSLTASKKTKHKIGIVCTLTGVVYYLTLIAMTALFFGGQYEAMGVTALVIFSGSGVAILMGMRRKGTRTSSARKKYH